MSEDEDISTRWRSLMMLGLNWSWIMKWERRRLERGRKLRLQMSDDLLAISRCAGEAFDALNADPYVPDDLSAKLAGLETAYLAFQDHMTRAAEVAQSALEDERTDTER